MKTMWMVLLMAACVVGCEDAAQYPPAPSTASTQTTSVWTGGCNVSITVITVDGHDYIAAITTTGYGAGMGFCHSESCKACAAVEQSK